MSKEQTKVGIGFTATGHHCCAVECNHKNAVNKCSFYSFPKNSIWFNKWVDAVKRCAVDESGKVLPHKRWTPEKHHRLCSCHFTNPPNAKSRRVGWNHVLPDKLPGVKEYERRRTSKSTSRTSPLLPPRKRRLVEVDDTEDILEVVCICVY